MNIENVNSIYKMLAGMNLSIDDSAKFIDYVEKNGKEIEETVRDIKIAKEKSEKKIDYSNFERNLVNSFKEIQNEINKDGLFQYSDEEEIEKFRTFFQEIVDEYVIIYKLKDDKDECARRKKDIEDIKNEIHKIISKTTLMTSEDIEKINELNFKLGVKNIEYKKILDLIEEDIKIITKNSMKTNFIVLLNNLDEDLNKLTGILAKLSLTPKTRQIVDKMFSNLIDSLVKEKNEYVDEIKTFKEICEKAGIVGTSLEKNDTVIYNGSKPYYGIDYTNLLQVGHEYKITKSVIKNNGYEEFYIEGFDKPFSVTLFDTKNEWKEKQEENNKTIEKTESNMALPLQDEINLVEQNSQKPQKIEIHNDNNENKEQKIEIHNDNNENKAQEIKNNILKIKDKLESNDNIVDNNEPKSVFKNGDYVVYNGTKDLNTNRDYTYLLQKGFSYKVVKSFINDKGEEEIYLEGIDEPFSITLFDIEEIWKERMNGLIFQMVNNIEYKPIGKEIAYTNAVMGLNNKPVPFNLKKSIRNILGKVKDKFEKIKKSIDSYKHDFEKEYIANFMSELNEYENQDKDLIDLDEFGKNFDEIKKEEVKPKRI